MPSGSFAKLFVFVDGKEVEIGDVVSFSISNRFEPCGNVVGGSLDGAKIPNGTRHGQVLQWDAYHRRWFDKSNSSGGSCS